MRSPCRTKLRAASSPVSHCNWPDSLAGQSGWPHEGSGGARSLPARARVAEFGERGRPAARAAVYQQASARDPGFAAAYAGIGWVHL